MKTLYIQPQSPWENSYCESFNGKLRNECSNGEIFYSLKEAQIVIEKWRVQYKTLRPHSALGYRPPAPAAYSIALEKRFRGLNRAKTISSKTSMMCVFIMTADE